MALRSFELEPSRENLLNTLWKDVLDRNKSVWQFARFCDAQEGKCSIAVDAQWGAGKTFFVRHVQLLMDSFNPFTRGVTEEESTKIRNVFSRFIGTGENAVSFSPEVCVYYDAWSNDNDGDPVLSLVYEIIKSTAQNYSFEKSKDCIKLVSSIADFFAGRNVAEIVELVRGDDPLSELKSQKDIHDLVADFLDSLLYEQGNRLIIIIDELDRCKPEYAVRLLERIKHYFTNDRITFVFSVNIDALQHTVKRYYGEGFDACRYLDRFFDYRITLPPANMLNYYGTLGLDNGYAFESVCKSVIEYCHFELREIEKFYRIAKIAAYEPTHHRTYWGFSEGEALQFSLCIVVPIVIGLRMSNRVLYNDFIHGRNSEPLIQVLGSGDIAKGYCSSLLNQTETYGTPKNQEKNVLLTDKLDLVYKALFEENGGTSGREIRVGECTFSRQTREAVMRATSLLSEFTSFE